MKTSGSRERPSAMYLPMVFDSFNPAHRAASRWVIRGSRLLRHFVAGPDDSTNARVRWVTRQSGSPPGYGSVHSPGQQTPIQDEDDDEYEDDGHRD